MQCMITKSNVNSGSPIAFFNYLGGDLPFSHKSDCKMDERLDALFMHEWNTIYGQTKLEHIAHVA